MSKVSQALSGITLALTALAVRNAQAQVVVTIDAPGVQSSTVPGVTTETFDGFAPGIYTSLTSTIGTYTSPGEAVVSADQYGGAGGTGNYFSIGAQSGQLTATLALLGDQGYFGFWFSAGDALNQIQLFENNTLEYTLDTPTLLSFINSQPNAAQYFGNPNSGQDSGEPFAYVNFFGTNGAVFNKIVFNNTSIATGFESDNHSIASSAQIVGTPITPEPGAWAMTVTGCLSGAAFLRRKRGK
jgi:hypothetical protein